MTEYNFKVSKDLVTISADDSVVKAMELMHEKNIRHLPVTSVNDENEIVGLLSETDVQSAIQVKVEKLWTVDLKSVSIDPSLKVSAVMSWPVYCVDESASVMTIVDQLLKQKISSLLVTREDEVVGIVTTEDLLKLLKAMLSEEKISWLEKIQSDFVNTPIKQILDSLANSGI